MAFAADPQASPVDDPTHAVHAEEDAAFQAWQQEEERRKKYIDSVLERRAREEVLSAPVAEISQQTAVSRMNVRPLYPKLKTPSTPVNPQMTQEELDASLADSRKQQEKQAAIANRPDFLYAMDAAIGGITADVYRSVASEEATRRADPDWNVDTLREHFRSNYGMEYWDAYENTKSRSDYDQLVQRAEREAASKELKKRSPVGAFIGSLLDPIKWLALYLAWLFYRWIMRPQSEEEKSRIASSSVKPDAPNPLEELPQNNKPGLFKTAKDAYFLAKCTEQVKHVLPDSVHLAEEFCMTTKPFLLAFRDKGASYDAAVNMVCMMILDKAETFTKNEDSNLSRARALITASNYCLHFSERWPRAQCSSSMMQAVEAFAAYGSRLNVL